MYQYNVDAPSSEQLAQESGWILLNFGTDWCGHCQAAQQVVSDFLSAHPTLNHIPVEDGKGRRLGREFQVKLWPSLVLLHQGKEVARVIRPTQSTDLDIFHTALQP